MLRDKTRLAQTASPKANGWLPLSGFTMAEILIALTIIGVVAALTIPQIIGNTNGRSNKLMMQKNYTLLAQALRVANSKLDFDTSDIDRFVNYSETGTDATPLTKQRSMENLLTKTLDIKKLDKTSYAFTGKLITYTTNALYDNSAAAITRAGSETSTGVTFSSSGTDGEKKRGGIFETRDGAYIIFPNKTKLPDYGCSKKSPCIAYIDVNGIDPPNALLTCEKEANTGFLNYQWENEGTSTDPYYTIIGEDYYKVSGSSFTKLGACTIDAMKTNDILPVLIYGSTIKPALNAADAVLSDRS